MELHELAPLLALHKTTFWIPSCVFLPWVVVDIPAAHCSSTEKTDGFVALTYVEKASTSQISQLLRSIGGPVRRERRNSRVIVDHIRVMQKHKILLAGHLMILEQICRDRLRCTPVQRLQLFKSAIEFIADW